MPGLEMVELTDINQTVFVKNNNIFLRIKSCHRQKRRAENVL